LALNFCVINYGLKPLARNFVFASSTYALHATDFSQWLVDEFLSTEFIWRKNQMTWLPNIPNFAVR